LPTKVLLFDLDDTLYEEKQFVESGFSKVAEFVEDEFKIAKEVYYKILIDIFNRGSKGNIFNLALERANVAYEGNIIRAMVKIYQEHNPKIRLAEDVKLLLIKLKKVYSLGIITDGYFKVQKKKVQTLRLEKMFDSIIYTDEYGREHWKPDVLGYKLALEEFRVLPEEAIYIGDNPYKDFIGAKKIGIPTVRILQPGKEYFKVRLDKEHEADYEIRELYEIIDVLKELG